MHQVVDLPLRRLDDHLRIDEPGRPDDLFDDDAARELQLVHARCGGDEDHAGHEVHELVEAQRPVVECRRQPEAVVHQGLLARAVAFIHGAELRQRLVRLVDDAEIVVREVVKQARRSLTRLAATEQPRVVLNAGTTADFHQHVDVEVGARLEALRLEQLVLRPQLG